MNDDQAFRIEGTLQEIKTKMELLITNGGSKGMIPEMRRELDGHEKQLNLWRGAIGVLIFLILMLSGTEAWHIFHLAVK